MTARRELVGLSEPNLKSCAGIPDKAQQITPEDRVLQYNYNNNTAAFSLKLLTDIDLELGTIGGCHAVFRIAGGVVQQIHFAAADGTWLNGTEAACAPIVRDCLKHPDRTPVPRDFDPGVAEPK